MRRSLLVASAIALAFLLPAIATAAVIVNSGISVSFHPTQTNSIYIAKGPGYSVANSSGFIGVFGDNAEYTNFTIDLSSVPGSGYVVLTNVLEIYNSSFASGTVTIWINGTLPSGVVMYESHTPLSFNGNTLSGTPVLGNGITSSQIHLTGAGVAAYIGFRLDGVSSGAASFGLQYTIS